MARQRVSILDYMGYSRYVWYMLFLFVFKNIIVLAQADV